MDIENEESKMAALTVNIFELIKKKSPDLNNTLVKRKHQISFYIFSFPKKKLFKSRIV